MKAHVGLAGFTLDAPPRSAAVAAAEATGGATGFADFNVRCKKAIIAPVAFFICFSTRAS